ncbi:unnamed protein product [Durusdinium trenchii]|uniref:Mif2/CENP-C cupin domain-containing protein n=2 Tax=Durusdinium trenchii TaxID=1381693 RepID=A0ABP0H8K1_9DINO
MPTLPDLGLEADGLPSVDFAIRSPNVEETSSEEGSIHADYAADAPSRREAGGYVDEIQLTEMDAPSSPGPEKTRGVPGSPAPLGLESEALMGNGQVRNDSAALNAMPSPVRGRRSLSPPRGAERSEAHDACSDTRQGRTLDLMDDSIMGASPRTEESMDSLASFFEDGHYHVPLHVPAGDEPLTEPSQQQRDCHSGRDDESHHVHCCQHGVPCTISFPSPVAPAGPGSSVGPPQFGRYVHETAVEVATATPPDSQDLLRARVPRIPAPTAHESLAELPSSSLSPRNHAAPSSAPMCRSGSMPEIPNDSAQHGVAYADASSQGGAGAAFERTSAGRSRPAAPAPEAHPPRIQSAGPMPADAEGGGRFGAEMRTEGQAFPAASGYRPGFSGHPMVAGIAPQSRGCGGPSPVSHPLNHAAIPFQAPQSFTASRVPFHQDISGVLPAVHPSMVGAVSPGQALSQGPISTPQLPPGQRPGVAMPWAMPSPHVPQSHGSFPMHTTFPGPMPPVQIGAAGHGGVARVATANEAGAQALPREGLRTTGPMPMEADSPLAGQGHARTELGSGINSGSGVAPPPSGPCFSAAGAAQVLRTEAAMPDTRPSAARVVPPAATQVSQTEGRLPPAEREPQTEERPQEHAVQNLSQGQLFSQEGASEAEDMRHSLEVAGSPAQFLSPIAPSYLPDVNSAEDASRQLETPPHIETMERGQQTTPENPRLKRKRGQQEPIRLPKEGGYKLVQVDMDEVHSCNQAGRPKRKQIRVLKSWQNERVVYQRTAGSACPTICGVMVAQPVEKDHEAIPLQLHLGEDPIQKAVASMQDKGWSPVPSNRSDSTFMFGQSEEEKMNGEVAADVPDPKPVRSHGSHLRSVERMAEVASDAAAATLAEATPPRARSSHTTSGFVRVPIAAGSAHACEIKVGIDNGHWMSCDIKIPPRSFNTPEELAASRSLLIYVAHCQEGTFSAAVDGSLVTLATGSSMVIRPGQAYCLRNDSDTVAARLKMVLINSRRSGM